MARIDGTPSADRLVGTDQNDLIRSGRGNDLVLGGPGNDIIFGEDGDDELRGEDGDDGVGGGAGADRLVGGSGLDRMAGSSGDDKLFGQGDGDVLRGDLGNDRIDGGAGDDVILGHGGIDTILARDGNDRVAAGNGDDRVLGGSGNDRLLGQGGADVLTGGAGADEFVYSALSHAGDRITDFNPDEGDTLELIGVLDGAELRMLYDGVDTTVSVRPSGAQSFTDVVVLENFVPPRDPENNPPEGITGTHRVSEGERLDLRLFTDPDGDAVTILEVQLQNGGTRPGWMELSGDRLLGMPDPLAGEGVVPLRAVAEDAAGNRAATNFRVDVTLDDTRDGSSVTDPRADGDLSLSSSAPSISATGRFVSYAFLDENDDNVIRVEDFGANASANARNNFLPIFAPDTPSFFGDTSISNDARTVAFASDTEVFVFRYDAIDQQFQQSRRISADSADFNFELVELAGNGDILAYENGSNVVLIDVDRPARSLTLPNAADASISDDGGEIAFVRNGSIFVQELDTADLRAGILTEIGAGSLPDLSSNGRVVAFEGAGDVSGQILIKEVTTATQPLVVSTDRDGDTFAGDFSDPVIAPDGSFVLFEGTINGNPDLDLLLRKDLDNNELFEIGQLIENPLLESRPVEVSADGRFVVVDGAIDGFPQVDGPAVYLVPTNPSDARSVDFPTAGNLNTLTTADVLDDAGGPDLGPAARQGAADVASLALPAGATLEPLLAAPEDTVA